MNERSASEKSRVPENLDEQKYREFQAAMDEEDRIMKEIERVFADTPDRLEAERIVLEK